MSVMRMRIEVEVNAGFFDVKGARVAPGRNHKKSCEACQ